MIKYKIGIDEAGRGPWAGPVVAAAFCFNIQNFSDSGFLSKLNDSKKLSEKNRKKLFDEIILMSEENKVFFGIGVVDNFYIDKFGIKTANREAMRRSILEIKRKINYFNYSKDKKIEVFIDGNDNYSFDELDKKPIFIIGGDSKIKEISAASIIAKVFRDNLMIAYGSLYPQFGLDKHKGYGTKKHRDYIKDGAKVTSLHRQTYRPVKDVLERKPRLLLHICCGPDATVPIMDLKKDYEVICFWYDPNIQPKTEHDKRLGELKKVCKIEGVDWIEGEYDVPNFFKEISGLEHTPEKGEKCRKCYDMRLKRTALEARKLGIRYWTSTLNTSPYKDLEELFNIGDKYSKPEKLKEKLEFLKIAFRKNGGFERSVEYTKKHNIYRQNYCGCIYSDTFPGGKEQFLKLKK